MNSVVQKISSNANVKIPVELLRKASLTPGSQVEIRMSGGHIGIYPIGDASRKRYSLAEMISRITVENMHEPDECGEDGW
jgi:antitoxin component of MazEF toxin-antitoxin module